MATGLKQAGQTTDSKRVKKQIRKAKHGRKAQRDAVVAVEAGALTLTGQAPKLTGSAGGETTVTYFKGEDEQMLRKGTYFSPAEWDAIQEERKRENVSATEIIRRAVREYLDL